MRWVFSLLAFCILEPGTANAEPKCAPHLVVRKVKMDHEGEPGTWIHAEIRRCTVKQLLVGRKCAKLAGQQAQELAKRKSRGARLALAVKASQRTSGALMQRVEAQAHLVARAKAWYRSPWFWGVMGLAVGVSAGVTAVVVMR